MLLSGLPWAAVLRGDGRAPGLQSFGETALITAGTVGLCLWLRPSDPFFLASLFPWTWLVPILLALRYGSHSAIFSSLLLLAGWKAARLMHYPLPAGFPKGYFVGGFIAALSCGEFRDLWHAQIHKLKKTKEYLEKRLASLGAAHQTLIQSHGRLMADFLTHPPTLRDALAELPDSMEGRMDAQSAQALLILLARFFQIESAALHAVEKGRPSPIPLASLGAPRPLAEDPLVGACLESGRLCHAVEGGAHVPGPYLLAAPLAPGVGSVVAVLVVERMPFFAFQAENLRGLFSVLGYFADRLESTALAARVTVRFPDCPGDFAAEYLRLHRLQEEAGLESVLAGLVPGAGEDPAAWMAELKSAGRAADIFWKKPITGSGSAIIALLPFCNEEQAWAYLHRLRPDGAGGYAGTTRIRTLAPGNPLDGLELFLASLAPDSVPRAVRGLG